VLEINDVRYRQKYVHYYRKLLHPQIAVLYCWHSSINPENFEAEH
jgi:hypothetical protein